MPSVDASVHLPHPAPHGFNIRHVSHITERVAPVLSLVSNAILATLLLRDKNQVMRTYTRVILQNLAVDCLFTLVSMFVEMQIEMNQGVYIFVVSGVFRDASAFWHYVMIGVWISSFALTLLIVNVEFSFRYMLLCRKYMLRTWQLFALGGLALLLSVLVALPLVAAVGSTEDHQAAFGHLMTDPIWFDSDGRQVFFVGADKTNPYFIMFLVLAIAYDTIVYGFCIYCGLATYLFTRKADNGMNDKTRYMQKQLNQLMLAEALSVAIVGTVPVAICMLVLLLDVTCVGLGIWLTILFAWIPIINPMTSIFLVAPYRRRVFGWCYENRVFNKESLGRASGDTPSTAFSVHPQRLHAVAQSSLKS